MNILKKILRKLLGNKNISNYTMNEGEAVNPMPRKSVTGRRKNRLDQCSPNNNYAEKIIKIVNLPYTVLTIGRSDIIEYYLKKFAEGRQKNFTPIIVKVSEFILEVLESAGKIPDNMVTLDCSGGKASLDLLWRGHVEDVNYGDDFDIDKLIGSGEIGEEITSTLSDEVFGRETGEIVMFEIPVTEPWRIFEWFQIGGWNECPDTETIVEVVKYWYEKYGAVPMMISDDEMEFYVDKKVPAGQSMELAKEHFAFCPDRAYQCTRSGTISEIADSLTKSNIWYFWWD